MNPTLLPEDGGPRSADDPGGPSRFARAVPRAGRLGCRVAAVAMKLRVGRRCATFGPRSLGGQRMGVPADARKEEAHDGA